jgi:L-alanine-DL-glutamate epimerase-like enolase superfamily enzyme
VKQPLITGVEKAWVQVPLRSRPAKHLVRENWDWTVFEVLRLRTDAGLTGIGETMVYYTWGRVRPEQIERVKGQSPFDLLWDDSLGAGLQMAVYDLAAKAAGVPLHRLLGAKVRDWCPLSWWAMDMPAQDWAGEVEEALSLGYLSAKFKARPWRDFVAILATVADKVPTDFRFDADFNGFLRDASTAAPYLRLVESVPSVTLFESPIPQQDVAGNAALRSKITRALAMHYGVPPADVARREGACDGFVIGGGAASVRAQGAVAASFNMPFFLQLVGTGITTAFLLHFGATLTHATWPAVTCHDIYRDDLIMEKIRIHKGYARVPEAPGLGVELDEAALERYRVEEGYVPPMPRDLHRVVWASGAAVVYPNGKRGIQGLTHGGVWDDFEAGNQPLFNQDVRLEILPDDGSPEWADLDRRARAAPVRE